MDKKVIPKILKVICEDMPDSELLFTFKMVDECHTDLITEINKRGLEI